MAGQSPNMDQFEAYFRRADLDGDGRISGAEAVGFFQGSGLPKQVLAQIWSYADRSHIGFLGRQEFFNALRLVTVAQSKRDLTPEIVNAALNTPAAAKIPPPKINLSAIPGQQPNPVSAGPQIRPVSSTPTQSLGFRGPGAANASVNQNYFSPQQNQMMRPAQGMPGLSMPRPTPGPAGPEYRASPVPGQLQVLPGGTVSRPPQSVSTGVSVSNISSDWYAGKTGGHSSGFGGVSLAGPSAVSKPELPITTSLQPTATDSKALVTSGNGTTSSSGFGGDMFSATPFQQKQELLASYSTNSSAIVPASAQAHSSPKPSALDSLQSNFSMLPAGNQPQHPRPAATSQLIMSSQGPSSVLPPGNSVGSTTHSTPAGNSLPPWPKMKPSDVQKYTKVFKEVDSDKDGKITGEQARNLFLSWRLPREVLKLVWELSDQDNDTMLSLREFCIALYLMERYREGRPLPAALPQSVMFDETLLSISGPPSLSYGNAGWGSGQGFVQQPGMVARPITPQTGMRPPVPGPAPHPGSGITSNQGRTQVPDLGDPFANHLGEGNSVSAKLPEVTTEEEKVDGNQNLIMDSREKLEYYRSKMQDIVLYKSRCDNRLNEITERASADKREAETLGKKYEEKYKQVAEIGSKLTIEEARFREIQERKTELHQAIINMEQGGSADGLLQVRADRIQSDLEELMKALSARCKKHGLDIESKALVELPAGWQPGIQEGAALWDEEWDKFEDEGFGNELTFDKSKQQENGSLDDGSVSPDSSSHLNAKDGIFSEPTERHLEGEYATTLSDDEAARSPRSSPGARTAIETSSPEYSHGKSAESDRFFDDSNWASAFDTNDDVDSVWGFDASKSQDGDFLGSSRSFDVNPGRADSPSSGRASQRKSPFAFDDSVPGTPLSRFGNSPPRFSNASVRDNLEGFSRFDSFNTTDMGFSSQPERLSRFDSMSSSKDFGGAFSRFDSMSSSRDFGGDKFSRSDSVNSSRDFGGPSLSRFDSINSTKDFGGSHGYSFDDADPFGSSGPFRVSSDDKSPRKRSDNWNSF
ncbi:PREDICTED: epidermal growth factor receptor substrate 15 isoform X2 [Tarenaya hassleriana]|uniref:epidermal growth factor receptor substrate 15 isoform X2 n=1 Tax=Tarenaya hassleriana TaxID=28532 RepID=UPI00053C468C|nr:PREDICTED: epidermal growth factor receptor substrate 15 isoform X2 [Tarenaya hassleriana]